MRRQGNSAENPILSNLPLRVSSVYLCVCVCCVHFPSAAEDDQYFSKVSFQFQPCLFPLSTSRTRDGLPPVLPLLQEHVHTCTAVDKCGRTHARTQRCADINKDGIRVSTSSHCTKTKLIHPLTLCRRYSECTQSWPASRFPPIRLPTRSWAGLSCFDFSTYFHIKILSHKEKLIKK